MQNKIGSFHPVISKSNQYQTVVVNEIRKRMSYFGTTNMYVLIDNIVIGIIIDGCGILLATS